MRRGFWDRLLLAAATLSTLMRGRWRWAGAATLVVAAGLGVLLLPGRSGGDAAAAGPRPILTATGPTPYDLYDARSPGGRPDGALFQTKPPRQRALAGPRDRAPAERVLPTIREHPVAFVPPAGIGPTPAPIVDRALVPPPVQPGLVPSIYDPVAVPTFGPVASNGTTPTIPIEPGNPTQPTVPPGSAVPEPSTWMTMLGGVGLLGALLRARRRRARAAA